MKFKKERKYIWFIFVFISLISSFYGLKINEKYSSQSNKEDNINQLYQSPELTVTNDYYKEIVLNKTEIHLILKKSNFSKKNTYILTVFGNSLTNFDITSYSEETYEEISLPIKKFFFNGYALIIDKTTFNNAGIIVLELKIREQFKDELIYLRTRTLNSQITIKKNVHYDIILNKDLNEDCFGLKKKSNLYFKFLTYTKNIKVSFSNFWEEYNYKIKINDESMIFTNKKYQYDEVCFSLDNGEIEGSLSVEMLELDSSTDQYEDDPQNIMIYNDFTLIRGLSSRHYLPRGYGIVHRTKDYLFKDKFSLHNIKFRTIKGNSKLYLHTCFNYPYCNFYKEELDSAEYKYENINGYISVKKYLEHDFKDYIAIVYCPEDENLNEECEYEIEMKNEDEVTYLYEKQISYSFVNLDGDVFNLERFKIDIRKEFTENDELYIYFNLFSGNAQIHFFNSKDVNIDDYKINNLGNVIIYIFQKNVIEKNPEIYIKVIRDQNAYFSISYEIKNIQIQNQYFIEEGILNYGKVLTNSENIHITNYYQKNNYYPYIININTFGNSFEINDFEEKAIINKYPDFNLIQIVLDEMEEEGNEEKQYSLGIKRNQVEYASENEEKQFLYNIIGFNANTKILINNGQNYINHLSQFNKEAIYAYTFSKRKNDDNKLVINFRKFSKNSVKISINSGESGNTDYIINRLSRIIILNNKEINQTCNYLNSKEGENECKILIKVTNENEDENAITDDPSTHIDFSIQIYGNDEPLNPIFLPQNIFISNLLLPNFKITYFVDVPQYGEGKIYVDFMEGGGSASAKLINRRTNAEESINFDYFNKYFDILSEKTKNCEEEDCEIFIELITYENIYKYNIYSKLKRKEDKEMIPFLVPEYEYI